MTWRKITIDNSVKYIPQSEQSQERESEPKTITNISIPREKDKNLSQNIEKIIKNVAAEGFGFLKRIMICCF